MFKDEILRILYLVSWGNMSVMGLETKEAALLRIRDLANTELRKVRREIRKVKNEEKK